jgi:hypothetical protein
MRAAPVIAVAIWWSLAVTVAAQQAAPADQGTSAAPAAPAVQGQQPPPPVTQPPHNPGQEVAGEQPQGPAVDIGPAQLRIGGYLGVTGIYRSTNSGGGPGTNFATIPYEGTLAGSVSESRLSAQTSRLSIRVDAPFPEARFRRLAGYFEMDFAGTTPGNIAVSSSSAGFRLRQAFTEVLYGDHLALAAGQAFSLMTPPKQQLSVWPSDYEMSQAVDTNYVTGLVWDRSPQVRFTWRPSPRVNWAVSVENPEQQIGSDWVTLPLCCGNDIADQYNTGDQALAVPNLMPDFVTRVAWNPSSAIHLDAGGVLRVFRHTVAPYDRDFKQTGGGLSINGRANPARGTRVIGQFATGSGLGRYVGGLAPDVAFRANGSIAPVRTQSWVLAVEQTISRRISAAGYYSGIHVNDTYFVDADGGDIGYGFPGSSNAVNRRIGEATATVSYQIVRTENRGSAQMNVQTSWLRREPWSAGGGPDSARAFLFFAQLRYNLP